MRLSINFATSVKTLTHAASSLVFAGIIWVYRKSLLLNDADSAKIEALKVRLEKFGHTQEPIVLCSDANLAVDQFLKAIQPNRSLTLTFIDPYGLNWSFESVKKLTQRPADLVIYFPDLIDMLRNWSAYYKGQGQSRLDDYLGTNKWRDQLSETNPDKRIDVLSSIYERQLKSIGCNYISYHRIKSQAGRPLYRLIFASRSELGRDVWERVSNKDRTGQGSFDWTGG